MATQHSVLEIEHEFTIQVPIEKAFESLIYSFTEALKYPDGKSMNMKLERFPGGRWYRDLGNNSGHLWGFVQSIKPPTLLELYGQFFMSAAATNHLIIRLKETAEGATLHFRHSAAGLFGEELKRDLDEGWQEILAGLKAARN